MKKLLDVLMAGALLGSGLMFGAAGDGDPAAELATQGWKRKLAQQRAEQERLRNLAAQRSKQERLRAIEESVKHAQELRDSLSPDMLQAIQLKNSATRTRKLELFRYALRDELCDIAVRHRAEMSDDDALLIDRLLSAAETLAIINDLNECPEFFMGADKILETVRNYFRQHNFM